MRTANEVAVPPPQASWRTPISASRLPVAPCGTPAWLYELAIRDAPINREHQPDTLLASRAIEELFHDLAIMQDGSHMAFVVPHA